MSDRSDNAATLTTSSHLYRGVSHEMFTLSGRALVPKACGIFEAPLIWGRFHWGDGQWGITESNAVLRHQWQQLGLPTSGISTTPVLERAKYYALGGGRFACGYVFVIDRRLLHGQGVREYIVADFVRNPAAPDDREVILVACDGGALPDGIVVDIRPWPEITGDPLSIATPDTPPAQPS